jgi:hypothetical protein
MITSTQKVTSAMHQNAPHSTFSTQLQSYSIRHIYSPNYHYNYRQIKVAHHCITIRGAGPAFGRPVDAATVGDLPVDLRKIIRGWFAWC